MMKQYHNGQRKGMMYGGNTRKPMMYGGKATKSRKKMQMGGNAMMSTSQNQQQMQERDQNRMGIMSGPTPTQQRMGMAEGSFAKLAPPYDKVTYADKIAGATKGKKRGN
jgi:hypothetical protein